MKKIKNYFHNKTIAITGVSTGLGKELAYYLAQYGVKLFLIARDIKRLEEVAQKIKVLGSQAIIIKADISRQEECKKLVKTLQTKTQQLDFLFLNAGISMWQKFSEIQEESYFRKLMDTNYFGVLYPLYYGLSYLKKSNTNIIVTLSLQSYLGIPYHTGYAASKHAVNGLLDSLLLEEEIKIVKVIPGWIRGTELRAKFLRLQKGKSEISKQQSLTSVKKTKNNFFSISVEKAVLKIITGLVQEKKKIHLPEIIKYIYWLSYLFPNMVNKKIKKAVNKE